MAPLFLPHSGFLIAIFSISRLPKTIAALRIEEKFNLVLEDYTEFERQLLDETLSDALFSETDWSLLMDRIYRINRVLVNLLSMCRLYVDQIPHDIKAICGENSEAETLIKKRVSNEYESQLAYRVMNELRNYVQHRGLPIQNLSCDRVQKRLGKSIFLIFSMVPKINVSVLREDGKFKRAVLKELEKMGDVLDLRPFVRDYMVSIGRIHQDVRASVSLHLDESDETLFAAAKDYEEKRGDPKELVAVRVNDASEVIDRIYIREHPVKRRKWLERKNWHVTHYRNCVVTNQI